MQVRRRMIRPPVSANTVSSWEEALEGRNPEQIECILHHEGPLGAFAVAGSGKTAAVVRRIVVLVLKHLVRPDRILACTFSRKAKDEMNDRLQQMLPGSNARVGTMHSLAQQFIRDEKPELNLGARGGWQVDDKDRYRGIVKDVLGYQHLNWKNADLTTVLQFIGFCKAKHLLVTNVAGVAEFAQAYWRKLPCGQRSPEMLVKAYQLAEKLRREKQLITYDDMLLEMWRLLTEEPSIREKWAAKWDHVIQDEGQDENPIQHELMKLLAQDHRNYMLVGDPAQSIYSFRGSNPQGLLDFKKLWAAPRGVDGQPTGPEPKVVMMHRNYRCGRKIVAAANGVLGAMAPHTKLKDMLLTPEVKHEGEVHLAEYANPDDEAEGVVRHMQELRASGTPWKDMVVLYRTNAQSRAVEELLLADRIPYVLIGGTNFYDRREVKDVLAYLRIAAGQGEVEDVRRCLNTPLRYLGKEFLGKVEAASESLEGAINWPEVVRQVADGARNINFRQRESAHEWAELIEELQTEILEGRRALELVPAIPRDAAKPAKLIEKVLADTEYVAWLTRDEGTESSENNRVSNIRELVRASERFPTVEELLAYIAETLEEARRAREEGEANPNRVTLMSIHRSKGLEWRVVFGIGFNEKVLPHARCEDVEEERRLAYVAMTRAMLYLYLSYFTAAEPLGASGGASRRPMEPSRFLEEAGLLSDAPGMVQAEA